MGTTKLFWALCGYANQVYKTLVAEPNSQLIIDSTIKIVFLLTKENRIVFTAYNMDHAR